jgi:hypothetical protein
LNALNKYHWQRAVILFGIVYLVVGVFFPNPSASNELQFVWRLGAWLICALAFAIHIGLEHFRFRDSPYRTALHVSASVSIGAFALAVAANINALRTGTGNQRLLVLALVIWPIMAGVPAFIIALVIAAVLERLRPNKELS